MPNQILSTASTSTSASPHDPRSAYRGETLLGRSRSLQTDSHETLLNNNMLVIGPSGSGKTRDALKPNLLQMTSSYLVLDTKGTLCREVAPLLAKQGYEVQSIDFSDLSGLGAPVPDGIHPLGYDPLRQIRVTERDGERHPNQQDIMSVARSICPNENSAEPFWDNASSNLLACLIALTLESHPLGGATFSTLMMFFERLGTGWTAGRLDYVVKNHPKSLTAALWRAYSTTRAAEKMHASIVGILAEKLRVFGFDGAHRLFTCADQVDFTSLGRRRTALFVTVSDIDRSMDPMVALFVAQAFLGLVREADAQSTGALDVPVCLFLDDFANLRIQDIDNILAVTRSREIWCTLLLQSVCQLEALYGRPRAMSIMGNCDTHLVLACQDFDTAQVFAQRADRLPSTLLQMSGDRALLFLRGTACEQVERYRLADHPRYEAMLAAQEAACLPSAAHQERRAEEPGFGEKIPA